jgi:uncharacterized protein
MKTTRSGRECRSLRQGLAGVKVDRRADDKSSIKGLAAVYYREGEPGTEYWLWDDMVERIMPGAFDRAIKEQHDARGLFNHDADQLLGRVSAGTLSLSLSSEGLAYDIPFDKADPDHQRVASKIDRGDVNGSSFAFIARAVTWEEQKLDDGSYLYIRQIKDLDLFDVGPVTWPAYEGTSAGRSKEPAGSPPEPRFSEHQELIAERDAQLRNVFDDSVAMRARMVGLDSN